MPTAVRFAPPGTQASPPTPRAQVQALLDRLTSSSNRLTVLEAGCGSLTNVRLPAGAHIVGVDVSAQQLERNQTIHEKIQADIQTYNLPPGAYDVVVCWDVLEHLPEPRQALDRLLRSVAPGGLIILAFPNVLSLKGIVAKYTPFWLHEAAARFIYGERTKKPGYQVFPTYLRFSITPAGVARLAVKQALLVELFVIHESGMQQKLRRKIHLTGPAWAMVRCLVRILSLGVVDPDGTDCLLVLRRA